MPQSSPLNGIKSLDSPETQPGIAFLHQRSSSCRNPVVPLLQLAQYLTGSLHHLANKKQLEETF